MRPERCFRLLLLRLLSAMLFAAPTGKDNLAVSVIKLIGILFRALLANRAALAMEDLALC